MSIFNDFVGDSFDHLEGIHGERLPFEALEKFEDVVDGIGYVDIVGKILLGFYGEFVVFLGVLVDGVEADGAI